MKTNTTTGNAPLGEEKGQTATVCPYCHLYHNPVMTKCSALGNKTSGKQEAVTKSVEGLGQFNPYVAVVNGKAAPWLEFVGEAGTRYYAETAAQWLSNIFAPERYEAREDAGWWYAELAPSVSDGGSSLASGVSSKDSPSVPVAGAPVEQTDLGKQDANKAVNQTRQNESI